MKTNPVRQHQRADLEVFVNKIIGDEPHLVRARDISTTGVYLQKIFEPDTDYESVGLEIMLPNSDSIIWAVGEVVREEVPATARGGVAVRFLRISEEDKSLIADYVANQRAA